MKQKWIVFLGALVFSAAASAITIEEIDLGGGEWQVTIDAPELPYVSYMDESGNEVIEADEFIIGFAIGNDLATSASTGYLDWNAELLGQSDWGARMTAFQSGISAVAAEFGETVDFSSASPGWGDVFTGYDQAVFYSYNINFDYAAFEETAGPDATVDYPVGPIFGDGVYDKFYFSSSLAASPYVAFVVNCAPNSINCTVTTQTGQTIHVSAPMPHASVSAPSVLPLIIAGLIGFGFVRGSKKHQGQ